MISAGPAPRRRCSRADRKYTADLPQPVRWTTSTRRCCSTSAEIASNWPARKSASARPVRSFSAVRAPLYRQALPPVGESIAPVSQVRLTTAPPEYGCGWTSLREETWDDQFDVGPPEPLRSGSEPSDRSRSDRSLSSRARRRRRSEVDRSEE